MSGNNTQAVDIAVLQKSMHGVEEEISVLRARTHDQNNVIAGVVTDTKLAKQTLDRLSAIAEGQEERLNKLETICVKFDHDRVILKWIAMGLSSVITGAIIRWLWIVTF